MSEWNMHEIRCLKSNIIILRKEWGVIITINPTLHYLYVRTCIICQSNIPVQYTYTYTCTYDTPRQSYMRHLLLLHKYDIPVR